jgi:hypothetical protein
MVGVPKKGKKNSKTFVGLLFVNNIQKRKKNSKTFVGLLFVNNIYVEQI